MGIQEFEPYTLSFFGYKESEMIPNISIRREKIFKKQEINTYQLLRLLLMEFTPKMRFHLRFFINNLFQQIKFVAQNNLNLNRKKYNRQKCEWYSVNKS